MASLALTSTRRTALSLLLVFPLIIGFGPAINMSAKAQQVAAKPLPFATQKDKVSYAIGVFFSKNIVSMAKAGNDVDRAALLQGLRDRFAGKTPQTLSTQTGKSSYGIGRKLAESLVRDNVSVNLDVLEQGFSDGLAGRPLLTESDVDTLVKQASSGHSQPVSAQAVDVTNAKVQTSSSTLPSSKSQKSAPAALNPDQQEAREHYKIATLAMKDGDLEVAAKELKQAAELDPRNSLVWYNLAIVLSKKDMSPAALDALEKALTLSLPQAVAAQARDLKVKLKYQVAKRKENPKILLGQELGFFGCPGYEEKAIMEQRDLFLVTVAPMLGPKESILYAKYADIGDGAIKKYYRDWDTKQCWTSCRDEMSALHPSLMGQDKHAITYIDGDVAYADYPIFTNVQCTKKCDVSYRDHAAEIGTDLRDLNFDVFVSIRSFYRCTWEDVGMKSTSKDKETIKLLDRHWVDFTMEVVTSDGRYFESPLTVYLGKGYEDTESLGRNPNLMFSRLDQELRAPLVQLLYSSGYK